MKALTGEIYAIRWNGGCYVGQTGNGSINRWVQHLTSLRKGTHQNKVLREVYALYGVCGFTFSILETGVDHDRLDDREDYWTLALGSINARPIRKIKEDRVNAVLDMLRAGEPYRVVHEKLGISFGSISRIRRARLL